LSSVDPKLFSDMELIKKIPIRTGRKSENRGVGFGYEMNSLTTPVIEIAGDGKTEKGIWYARRKYNRIRWSWQEQKHA
jgi:hypothetical protein